MRMISITLLRTQVNLQERLGGDCETCFWAVSICSCQGWEGLP